VVKFISGRVVSRSPGVYFIRHRPHAKPENRLWVSIVFMTGMKLIRAFRDCANVLKHLVGGGSASGCGADSVYPATTCLNTALKPAPTPEARWLKPPT